MQRILTYVRRNVATGLRVPLRSAHRQWPIAVAYGIFALAVGLGSGLLHLEWPSWFEVLVVAPLLIIYPSFIEEIVFRGLMLPRSLRDASAGRRVGAVTVSTALFVAMHPVNASFVGMSDTSQFLEPSFLAIVTALGYACGYLYLRSGSLWAPIALHWSTVAAWNLFLGRAFET